MILDRNRFNEERSAAIATLEIAQDAVRCRSDDIGSVVMTRFMQEALTVVSTHLDVWAEMRRIFHVPRSRSTDGSKWDGMEKG